MRCFCTVRWLTVVTLLFGAAMRADEPRSELRQAPEPPSYAQILRVAQRGAPLQADRASDAPTPRDTPPAPPARTHTSLALPHLSGETQPSRSSRIADAAAAREQLLDRLTAAPRDDRHRAVGRPFPIDALDDGDEALLRPGNEPDEDTPPPTEDLAPALRLLRTKIRRCLAIYYFKPVAAENHSPWGVMHTMLAYGVDSQILAGGQRVNAAGWLSWNGSCRGSRLMRVQQGELEIRQGPGFQGHPGQFLAMLAQMRVKIDHEFRVDGKIFTVADLVEYEQQNVRQGTELTFPLIGLMHYGPSDEQWTNRWGQTWSIPQLVREEIRESVRGAACGGVHRLMALSYVVRKRLQRREPLDGEYLRAKQHVDDYLQLAYQLQNPDGSYSTNWFEGRGADPDIDQRLLTTGHTLEWMVYAVREDALQHREIVRAANYLAELMVQRPAEPWEIGPRSHALRSLALYDERVFGGAYGQRASLFADVVEEHGDQRLTRSAAVKLPNQISEETDSWPRTRFRRRFGR